MEGQVPNDVFEERMRRMILTNENENAELDRGLQPGGPVVRLPSSQAYAVQQTYTPPQSVSNGPTHVHRQRQSGTVSDNGSRQQHLAQNVQRQQRPQQQQNPQRFQREWRQPYTPGMNPHVFNRSQQALHQHHHQQPRQLYESSSQFVPPYVQQQIKAQYLQSIVEREVPLIEMSQAERQEKEAFRIRLQQLCQELCASDAERLPAVELYCFGSFQSGFASAGSDMDLVIVPKDQSATAAQFSLSEDDLPRRLENRLLQAGLGARLLTRTRVPIIKVCELPSGPLLSQLRMERSKWDMLSFEAKYPHLKENGTGDDDQEAAVPIEGAVTVELVEEKSVDVTSPLPATNNGNDESTTTEDVAAPASTEQITPQDATELQTLAKVHKTKERADKTWTRERKAGALDFPKDGIGIQSDINFFNPLGLHNTHMLRCYSLCDPRVRPMILFVKAWAKKRKINSAYSGTLSSYGYVLMVLHYLVNVVRPPVLPNLQLAWRPDPGCTPQGADRTQIDQWIVDFWRREDEITAAASRGMLTSNRDSLGQLLAGFFRYYASQHGGYSFHWMQQVLSLRSPGGIISKEEKGWVKARTDDEGDGRKVQYRYLFCIEDPFELEHNVARTVTHHGIVAIRDEFRRAGRILQDVGMRQTLKDGDLFDAIEEGSEEGDVGIAENTDFQASTTKPGRANFDTEDVDAFPALAPAQVKSASAANTSTQQKQVPKKTPKAPQAKQEQDPMAGSTPAINEDGNQVQDKPKKHYRRRPQRAARKVVLNPEA